MPQPYTKFAWFYPPRSDSVMPYKPSPVLDMWKSFPDAMAQYKMDGTNDQLVVFPDRHIEHWGRVKVNPITRKADPRGIPNKLDYVLPTALRDQIVDLTPKGVFTIYNVELLHYKTTMVKNTLYFFDVLVWAGQHMLGVEYAARYKILSGLFGKQYLPLDIPQIDGKVFVAENLPFQEWDTAWERVQSSAYCEGLVLKRFGAVSRLQIGDREKNNSGFLCRIRKPKKNYQF